MVRGLDTTVRKLRRKVFEEVARLGFRANEENFAETLNDEVEAIPYRMVNDEKRYRESVYRARAVLSERLRLAMGLSLRPEDKPVHLTAGMEASNISDKYYEPPLMQVIPSACEACEEKGYEVSNMCKGCLAHPCMEGLPQRSDFHGKGGNPILISPNVSSAESVNLSALMTPLQRRSAPAPRPAESAPSLPIRWDGLMWIRTNVCLVECVW